MNLLDAVKPFARIAAWSGLWDRNTDGLPVEINIVFPGGVNKSKLTGKELRLLSEAFEAAASPQASPAPTQMMAEREALDRILLQDTTLGALLDWATHVQFVGWGHGDNSAKKTVMPDELRDAILSLLRGR